MSNFNLRDFQNINLQENSMAIKREEEHNLLKKIKRDEDELIEKLNEIKKLEKKQFIDDNIKIIDDIYNKIEELIDYTCDYISTVYITDFRGKYTEAFIFIGTVCKNINKIKEYYNSYVSTLNEVKNKYGKDECINIENEHKYNIKIKEIINKINICIYNKLIDTVGIAYDNLNIILKEIFNDLEYMGAEHVEISMEDTNISTIKMLAKYLRENGMSEGDIFAQLSQIYSVDLEIIKHILNTNDDYLIDSISSNDNTLSNSFNLDDNSDIESYMDLSDIEQD